MIGNNNEFYQNSLINVRKDNDEWKNAASKGNANYDGALCIIPTPVKRITGKISKSAYRVVFTPAADFEGIYFDQKCTPATDSITITPGDGNIYNVIVNGYSMYYAEIIGRV